MGHHHKHCGVKHCKYHITPLNEDKQLFPYRPSSAQGKVGFCEQIRAFPVGRKLKCK